MPDVEVGKDAPEDDTWRGALEQSFEKSSAPAEEAPAAPAVEAAPAKEEPAPAGDRARDDQGRFVPAAASKGNTAPRATEAGAQAGVVNPPAAAATGHIAQTAPPAPVSELKAPQSWKPAERELWAKLSPEAQQVVYRRERQMEVERQRSVEAQRSIEPLVRVIQPHMQTLQQRGLSPTQVISNMLATEQALSHPDEMSRARVLAQAMSTYRVGVEALAKVLDGAPVQQQPINEQEIIRKAQEGILRTLEQQRFQSATQSVTSEVEEFEKQADFLDYDGIRETMADLLESAAKRGLDLSLSSAYDQACWTNPEVRKVFQQREASKQVATSAEATQRAKAASSSVRSSPNGGSGAQELAKEDSWRAHLEASWDKASQKV